MRVAFIIHHTFQKLPEQNREALRFLCSLFLGFSLQAYGVDQNTLDVHKLAFFLAGQTHRLTTSRFSLDMRLWALYNQAILGACHLLTGSLQTHTDGMNS